MGLSKSDQLIDFLRSQTFEEPSVDDSVEVHSLVSHNHVPLLLAAAATMQRQWGPVRHVAHDDGSLTDDDIGLLASLLPPLHVIRRPDADTIMSEALATFPTLRALRAANVRIMQLVDYYCLSEAERVIGMDSDILMLRPPERLVEWAQDGPEVFLYSPEYGWEAKGVHWLPEALPGFPFIPAMCSGFVAVRRQEFLDLEYLERVVKLLPAEVRDHGRFVTQMLHSLLAGRLSDDETASLGVNYRSGRAEWIGDSGEHVMYHYFSSHERSSAEESLAAEWDRIGSALAMPSSR